MASRRASWASLRRWRWRSRPPVLLPGHAGQLLQALPGGLLLPGHAADVLLPVLLAGGRGGPFVFQGVHPVGAVHQLVAGGGDAGFDGLDFALLLVPGLGLFGQGLLPLLQYGGQGGQGFVQLGQAVLELVMAQQEQVQIQHPQFLG